MEMERIEQLLKENLGKDIVVTTSQNEIIFIWDKKEQLWSLKTSWGPMLFDTDEVLEELHSEEVYKIEGVC